MGEKEGNEETTELSELATTPHHKPNLATSTSTPNPTNHILTLPTTIHLNASSPCPKLYIYIYIYNMNVTSFTPSVCQQMPKQPQVQ